MEVTGMGETNNTESHITSASAFVEGGIQEACEDACSICLEAFCENDPSTVTSCKHEFHLQCILEWCQRSSNCPMCWQSISLKDPTSQELLEAVVRERSFRFNPARNSRIFHHPTLGDFELQHLPVAANDTGLEDRIIQHFAAAAAMGRAQHFARRDGSRIRSSAHAHRQFLVFSTHPNSLSAGPVSAPVVPVQGEPEPASITVASPSVPLTAGGGELSQHNPQFSSVQSGQISASPSTVMPISQQRLSINDRNFANQSSLPNPDRAGPSDFHSLSDSWKSRLNAMSTKYKDSISKSTRVWKEKLFSRSTSMADIGSDVRREVSAGIANVSCMMERLETREHDRDCVSLSENLAESSATEQASHNNVETRQQTPLTDNKTAAFAASSVSH